MHYDREHKHRGHIQVIGKGGKLVCATDGELIAKKTKVRKDDDFSFSPDTSTVQPHQVLFSARKPDGWKKVFDDADLLSPSGW